jgi:hypothetical protein
MEVTPQQIREEIGKCRNDPIYFIEKYCKVRHPLKGIIPFKLFPFQRDVVRKLLLNRFVIIVKGRQLGLSTVMAAYAVWFACFYSSKEIQVIANKGDVATNFIRKCKVMLKYIPDWLKPNEDANNRQSVELDNSSIIKASTTTEDAGRSDALSLLIIDEAAMIDKIDEVWTAARPTLSTGGAAVVISTPKGVGNWFWQKYTEAETGQADDDKGTVNFVPMKLPWTVHPERDDNWAASEQKDLSPLQWAQEHECDFQKSGNTVIDYETIKWYEDNLIQQPISKGGFDQNIWYWKEPELGKTYIVCGDVARGDGSDFSASHVICVEDYEQVAEYRGKITPDVFGTEILLPLGYKYNTGMIIVENNSIGLAAIQKILEAQYPRTYWSKKGEQTMFFDPLHWNVPGPDKIPGFQTTAKTRPLMISAFEEALRTKQIKMHSSRFINELKTFVWINTGINIKAQALNEKFNDDLIMSLAVGTFARNTTLRWQSFDTETLNIMLNSMAVEKSPSTGYTESVSIHQEMERKKQQQYKIPGLDEDLSWLVS